MKSSYPIYLANRPILPEQTLTVTNKFTGREAARVGLADERIVGEAIGHAAAAADACRVMPAYERAAVLHHVMKRITERVDEIAEVLAIEAGKPIRDARGEVMRATDTFRIAAEEATRINGEYLPLDISPRGAGFEGICIRVPVGPCAFVTPFNFPLNLVAHKVAPAIAVGCPWVLKPASYTPITALLLGEILAETKLPPGAFSILPCSREAADALTTDDRFKLLSFTGSPEAGWKMKSRAGKKKVVLELGGNAACIVDADADLDHVASRLMIGAFYQSGQSCISVQRIFIHQSIYEPLKSKLVAAASKLKSGDPLNEETFLGPLISEDDARRVESWIGEAASRGAKILCGGKRNGSFVEATLLEGVADDQPISCREAFGPVAILEPFSDFGAACKRVNDSAYGLQAGVFTRDIHKSFYALRTLEVGGVVINDVPSVRVDAMPYGGVKDSGLGREGVRYAMEDMTERRLMLLKDVGRAGL